SGSVISKTKLLVPSGMLLQDNCGDTLSPTQFGLFGALAALLATFFGIILPSAKVVDLRVKISAASAVAAAKPNAIIAATIAVVTIQTRFSNIVSSMAFVDVSAAARAAASQQPQAHLEIPQNAVRFCHQFRERSTSARSLIHGIISRSLAPICSIGWAAHLARMALKDV